MSVELTVPQLGESITEAVVGKWHKKEGDSVNADEPVLVLETDKVAVDVPAPSAGALAKNSRKEGDKVKVGEVLGTIAPGSGKAAAAASAPTPAATAPAPAPASNGAAGAERAAPVTPVAKRVAEDKGVDTSKVRGSGPQGRILKDDVLSASAPKATGTPVSAVITAAREERVKMTPLRKRVAERLLQAQSQAAILTTFNEVDVSAVMALRKRYGEAFLKKHGVKLGFMSFFVRAAIEALKAFPQLNASIDGEDVVFRRYYDIGVAVSGTRGLVVPVLRDADTLSMADVEKVIGEMANKARSDKLSLAELQGGTFTITNGGIFGSMLSTPILNPPQTGILGMHNIVDRPVVRDGEIVVRPIMYLALSYDHRLVDGREAVQFLVKIKDCIEDPERMLLEV
jgi:2-oxoglutarate dehydrogenase E2 component (dihydrolipoamide succinyltransferase)